MTTHGTPTPGADDEPDAEPPPILPDTPSPIAPPSPGRMRRLGGWLVQGPYVSPEAAHPTYSWWRVMCLTGVDYFSTLGYQPGIAFLAAGVLSPVATLILVAVTLLVALPVYRQVAKRSPHGQGSIAMLEELLPRWRGKVFVLVLLIGSSVVTTVLIPAEAFLEGGEANDRALAYLAHLYLGHVFGTVYDLATIAILWFAGASAIVGLLNLVPRYLPPYGMAPEWARATRPLVFVFTAVTFVVTILFNANVDAQAGAYATGVLFLMASASVAVTIDRWQARGRWLYLGMTVIFVYTLVANMIERPEGIKIASFFILAIVAASLVSRAIRSTELRITQVRLSPQAHSYVDDAAPHPVRIVAHRPDKRMEEEYDRKERQAREDHSLEDGEPLVFLEVSQGDASDFQEELYVRGVQVGRHRVLRCRSAAIPNAIAALLLHVQAMTGKTPHAYFGWTEGNPITYVLKYLALGEGDTAPVTREVLRKNVRNPLERPRIHVG